MARHDTPKEQQPHRAVTLDAMHAVQPTYEMRVSIDHIRVGPKRTIRRGVDDYFSQPVYFVPPPAVWMPDTVRMLFHEFAGWLPKDLAPHAEAMVQFFYNKYLPCSFFRLLVVARSNDKHTIEVHGDVHATALSEPMRSTLSGLINPVPLQQLPKPACLHNEQWAKRRDRVSVEHIDHPNYRPSAPTATRSARPPLTLKQLIDQTLTRNLRRPRDPDDVVDDDAGGCADDE